MFGMVKPTLPKATRVPANSAAPSVVPDMQAVLQTLSALTAALASAGIQIPTPNGSKPSEPALTDRTFVVDAAEQSRQRMLDWLISHPGATCGEVVEALGVTKPKVHNDANELARQGRLVEVKMRKNRRGTRQIRLYLPTQGDELSRDMLAEAGLNPEP